MREIDVCFRSSLIIENSDLYAKFCLKNHNCPGTNSNCFPMAMHGFDTIFFYSLCHYEGGGAQIFPRCPPSWVRTNLYNFYSSCVCQVKWVISWIFELNMSNLSIYLIFLSIYLIILSIYQTIPIYLIIPIYLSNYSNLYIYLFLSLYLIIPIYLRRWSRPATQPCTFVINPSLF